jgi:hypothetical protein
MARQNIGDRTARDIAKDIHASVATLAALSAIPESERIDRMLCIVATDNASSLWRFNAGGTETVNSDNYRIPDDGDGNWEIVTPGLMLAVDEFTDPATADAAGLEAATTVSTSVRTVTSFLAGGVAALAAYPRNITFTTAGNTPADAPASATITGTDVFGNALTETVNIAQTATIASGVKCFKTVTSIAYTVGQGTDATVSIGFGPLLGLAHKPKVRAGTVAVVDEIAVGARVTTGTFATPTTSPPNGSYSPSSAPNGSRDYAVYYERDLTAP